MALKEVLVKYSADSSEVTSALSKGEKAASSAEGSFTRAAKAVAAFFAVGKVKDFIGGVIDAGAQIGIMAQRIGEAPAEFQRWAAAANLSGVETQELANSMAKLGKNAAMAAQNAGSEQAQAFKRLGVNVKDASGAIKPASTLLRETGLALGKMTDKSKRGALSMQLMEEAGLKLIPMFEGGDAELTKLLGTLDEFGGGYSDNAIKAARESKAALLKYEMGVSSLKGRLAEFLLPTLTRVVEWVAKAGVSMVNATRTTSLLQAAVGVLSTIMVAYGIKTAAVWGPVALKFALIGVAIIGAIVVLDELITLMRGGKTVLGDWINSMDRLSGTKIEDRMRGITTWGGKVEELLSSLGSIMVQWVVNRAQEFGLFFTFIGQDIAAAFGAAKSAIVTKLTEWGTAIWGMLPSWMTSGLSLAGALISGIVTGIIAGATKVKDAVKNAAKGAIDAAKDVLGIKSPSKVFAEIGKFTGLGFAQGVDDSAPGVMSATMGLGANAVSAAAAGVAAGPALTQAVSNTVNVYGVAASPAAVGSAASRGVGSGMGDASRALLAALDTA